MPWLTRTCKQPRVTVDEIIARRAPLREAKQAVQEQVEGSLDAEGDDDANSLEEEMMAELAKEFGSEDESGTGGESDDASEQDGDEQEDDSVDGFEDDAAHSNSLAAPNDTMSQDLIGEDDEDWLGIGEDNANAANSDDQDEDSESNPHFHGTFELTVRKGSTAEAPSGFAALANLEDDDMDASGGEDDAAAGELSDVPSNAEDAKARADARAAKAFFTSHSNATGAASSFTSLPGCTLSRQLLLALSSLNLSKPTPIQSECIPVAMMGKDIVASSATGSGKTVAFWVGVLERLLHRDRRNPATRVVVMTPTRELAVQVHGVGVALARYTDIQFCLCVGESAALDWTISFPSLTLSFCSGGLSLKVQEAELKQRPDVVVSTPGRLIDHVRNTPSFTMDGVEVLVLDEADRMLEEVRLLLSLLCHLLIALALPFRVSETSWRRSSPLLRDQDKLCCSLQQSPNRWLPCPACP